MTYAPDDEYDVEMHGKDGFSLIELLIVIAVVGVLTAVVAFAVAGISDESEENACAAGARTLAVAVESYFAQHGDVTIPPTPSDSTEPERFEQTLVADGIIRGTSKYWDIDELGRLVEISPCD